MTAQNSGLAQAEVVSALRELVEPNRVLHTAAARAPFESDGLTAFRAQPLAVVLVETAAEVVRLVRWCHENQIPYLARGSGTSLSGGSTPIPGGIVLALNRMNRILTMQPADLQCRVEPGVINLAVSHAARPHGLYYAPDPSSQAICTIGGNVAFNSGGAHCLKYGMTSNHVLGLTYVTPTGEVEHVGHDSLEGLGPDLPGFFVGSEGRFGVALELTLRLLPLVPTYKTVLAAYNSTAAAGEAVARVVASGMLPGAMEIMDSLAIQAAEVSVNAGYPKGAAAILIVELEGDAEQVTAEFEELKTLLAASGSYEIREARNEAERASIWKGRKSAFSAVGRLSPDYIVQDGVVPRSKLGKALETIESLSRQHDIRVANVFHAGDGNLHPLILFDGREEGALHRAEKLAGEILQMCIDMGGSITGEHGVGIEKSSYLPLQYQGKDLQFMYDVSFAMDPSGVANRDKKLRHESWPEAPASSRTDPYPPEYTGAHRRIVEEMCRGLQLAKQVRIVGGGTKSKPDPLNDAVILHTEHLSGILEYNPAEFTITTWAGTSVDEVKAALATQGQYLPFCPPARASSTMGGIVSCGLSGEGRLRFGGIRDFILGVRCVDGQGDVLYGGGRVVKNAAGFDLPKLLVGSLGSLALILEITFKVFPQPPTRGTLTCRYRDLDAACRQLLEVRTGPCELDSLCLVPHQDHYEMHVRLAGSAELLPSRLSQVANVLTGDYQMVLEDETLWDNLETEPLQGQSHWRIPIMPSRISELEPYLQDMKWQRCYGVGGNLLRLRGPDSAAVNEFLLRFDLGALGLQGLKSPFIAGTYVVPHLLQKAKGVLDPQCKFSSPLPYAVPVVP